MVAVVTGKIGSGKTYWAVNFLVEKHYEFKTEILDWVSKTGVRIVTNIRNLIFPHVDLDREIADKGLRGVFSKEYVDNGNIPTIFLIDEAQAPDKFHRKYYDPEVALFFQTCRHYGVDILMITQDTGSLAKEMKLLAEYEIVAQQRSKRFKNAFLYHYMVDGERLKRQVVKFKTSIANCYQSFIADETDAPKSMVWRYIFMVLALLALGGCIIGGLAYWWNKRVTPTTSGGLPAGTRTEATRGHDTPQAAYAQSTGRDIAPNVEEGYYGTIEKRAPEAVVPKGQEDAEKEVPSGGSWVERDYKSRQKDTGALGGGLIRDEDGRARGSYVIYE